MKIKLIHSWVYYFLEKNYKDLWVYRNFYGYTFLALSFFNNKKIINFCLKEYKKINKNNPNFHYEFNNYALLSLNNDIKLPHDLLSEVSKENIKFRDNNVSNWFLLKHLSILKFDKSNFDSLNSIKNRIKLFQDNDWLIWDDYNNKSFQYHCFSSALIEEVYNITNDKIYMKAL